MTAVPQPTWDGPYVDPITEGWMGSRVAECLGISAPYSSDDLCDFFEKLTELYDAYRNEVDHTPLPPEGTGIAPNPKPFVRTKVTDEMVVLIQQRVRQNMPSAAIRAELRQQFGVEITPSHMSHMKRRIARKDTL